ncbi:MAG: HAD family hydrolase [Gemmatimonadota bacterium]
MNGIDLVLVDFDDTLVDTAPRFERARRALFALLHAAGFDPAEVDRVHHCDVDPGMRREHGLGPHRLPLAFAATYSALCSAAGVEPAADALAECERLGRAVVGTPPPLAGALGALERLAAVLPTALYTQAGDAVYQLGCVREAGAAAVVGEERVRIVPLKTAAALRDTLDHFGVADPGRAWLIGNSIRSDINPALEVGVRPVMVEVKDPWQHDVVEPLSNGFPRAPTFADAVELLLNGRR